METHPQPTADSKATRLREHTEHLFDGTAVRVRPISPADVGREQEFLTHLSPELRAYRFLGLVKNIAPNVVEELTRDASDEITLIALVGDKETELEVGAARYRTHTDPTRCDCAVTIDPEWQRRGVGTLLMRQLIEIARRRGIRFMYAADAARCAGVHTLAERLGFRARLDPEDPAVTTFELEL